METRTYRPNTDFDVIVNELSYRVGRPDLRNEEHLGVLVEILKEAGWNSSAITYFVRNIIIIAEATPIPKQPSGKVKIYLQKGETPPKGRKLSKGPRGGMYFMGTPQEKSGRETDKVKSNQGMHVPTKKKKLRPLGVVRRTGKQPQQNKLNPATQDVPKKTPVKQEPQVDKSGKYIPSDEDRQVVSKAMQTTSTKSGMLAVGDDKKMLAQFEDDVDKLLNTRDPKLASDMVSKYKLSVNKDPQLGNSTKLYIGSISRENRKIFSTNSGNQASTIVAKVLQDAGAIGERGGYTKKSMTANKIFTNEQTLSITKDKSGSVKLGNTTIPRAKNYDYKNVEQILIKNGFDSAKAKKTTDYIHKWVDKHNFTLDHIDEIVGGTELKVLQICDKCDVSTLEGIGNTKKATVNKVVEKMTLLSGNSLDKTTKKIIEDFSGLNSIKDSKQYEDKLNDILHQFSMNKNTTETSADITEVIDFLRVLNKGVAAYLPSASNFALGDLLTAPLKQPTIADIIKNKNSLSTIFVSLDDRSVKKGTGGASASKGKIQLTKFKNKDTQSDLMRISDNYTDLINKDDTKSADKLISELEKKYSNVLKNDPDFTKRMQNKDTWIKSNSKKLYNTEVWDRYYKLGYMMQSIYNSDIDFQAFQNSKYDVKKAGVEHDLSDGIHTVAKLGFEPSMIGPTGKPLNPYPTRFHHHKN